MTNPRELTELSNEAMIAALEDFIRIGVASYDCEIVEELVRRLKKSEAMVRMLSEKIDDYYWRR